MSHEPQVCLFDMNCFDVIAAPVEISSWKKENSDLERDGKLPKRRTEKSDRLGEESSKRRALMVRLCSAK